MSIRTTRSEHGFTVVEAAISSFLFLAIVAVIYSTTVIVTRYKASNDAEFAAETAYRQVLDMLKEELSDSSLDRDPITNQPRFSVETDGSGRQSLRFQKLVGAETVGGEVSARWSSDILITYDDEGHVYRVQDGTSIVVGSGVSELRFETTSSNKFRVVCVTDWLDPRTGRVEQQEHEILIRPNH